MALTPYMLQRQKLKNSGGPTPDQEKKEKKEKGDFFDAMIKKAPRNCMETGKPLGPTMAMIASAVVAHILPKSKKDGVPSQATNPLNIVYLTGDVHTDFDRKGKDFIVKMKIFPLLRERVAEMWDSIPQEERRRVPEYYNPLNKEYDQAPGKDKERKNSGTKGKG